MQSDLSCHPAPASSSRPYDRIRHLEAVPPTRGRLLRDAVSIPAIVHEKKGITTQRYAVLQCRDLDLFRGLHADGCRIVMDRAGQMRSSRCERSRPSVITSTARHQSEKLVLVEPGHDDKSGSVTAFQVLVGGALILLGAGALPGFIRRTTMRRNPGLHSIMSNDGPSQGHGHACWRPEPAIRTPGTVFCLPHSRDISASDRLSCRLSCSSSAADCENSSPDSTLQTSLVTLSALREPAATNLRHAANRASICPGRPPTAGRLVQVGCVWFQCAAVTVGWAFDFLPPRIEFDGRYHPYDFSPRLSYAKSRESPRPKIERSASPLQASTTTVGIVPGPNKAIMSTSHRGLPPPAALGLPDPSRQPALNQPLASLPAVPSQWPGHHDDLTRDWYLAKTEEQRYLQEGEKTRQEELRLEQRRIEYSILRESLQAGVPPSMIPMIYAGIGGANLATVGPTSGTFAAQQTQQQILPSQHAEQPHQGVPLQTTFSAYQPVPRTAPTSAPRSAAHAQLPRLTTNEIFVHPPAQQGPGSAHPLQQSQHAPSDPPSSSPSIYFHHWVPPTDSKTTQPPTPASRGEPHSAHLGSHLSESDSKDSPRKRKAQGGHQPNPPPAIAPQHTSPSISNASLASRRGAHGRSCSTTSAAHPDSRPDSRREPEPSRAMQPDHARTRERQRRSPSHEEPTSRSSAASSGERETQRDRPEPSRKQESRS
nr:hypothetical protein CFP56_19624 [Quercus suber]